MGTTQTFRPTRPHSGGQPKRHQTGRPTGGQPNRRGTGQQTGGQPQQRGTGRRRSGIGRRIGVGLALFAGAVGTVFAVFARKAPLRIYPWYVPGVIVGVGGSELPVPIATGQLAAGGLATALGAGRSRWGWAGLLAIAGSAAGLFTLHKHQLAATEVLDRALTESVGLTPVAAPGRPRGVELAVTRDIAYHDESDAQRLDVWRAADLPADAAAPVLVTVHGGSWVRGSKAEQGLHLVRHLAERGWVCVSIDYRLGPQHRWPAQIVDVKRSLAWVREHIADYGGDPSFLAITGGSAGGHLATVAALTPNEPALQPGFEDADTAVSACVPFYGVFDLTRLNDDGQPRLRSYVRKMLFDADPDEDPETWRTASPTLRIDADAPPLFVIHGDRDEIVTVNQARAFAERARQVSHAPFGYAELPYAHHAFDTLNSTRTNATIRAVARFLTAVRAKQQVIR